LFVSGRLKTLPGGLQIGCLKTGNTGKATLRFATLSPIFFL